jgi:hypothetical protein
MAFPSSISLLLAAVALTLGARFTRARILLFQIAANFRNGHTGIQSLVTLSMNTLGSVARIFTTLHDKNGVDASALVIYALSFALNGTMAAQVVLFKANTAKALAGAHTKKAK